MPNDSPTSKIQTTDFFACAIALPGPQGQRIQKLNHSNCCQINTLTPYSAKLVTTDWIVQCFTSPPTQYRLDGRRFVQVKRPNQQYQSTERDATKENKKTQR